MMRIVNAVWLTAVVVLFFISPAMAEFKPFQPLPAQPPIPDDNPMFPAKINLGQQLFFDPRLSVNGSLSCNGCHNLFAGGEDGRSVSKSALGEAGKRSSPTLWNVGFNTVYFLDGRAISLEEAIKEHLINKNTMAMPSADYVVKRVNGISGYQKEFQGVFGDEVPVSYGNITKALAAYLRTLVTQDSLFDQYLRGNKAAMSEQAQQGFDRFIEVGCASCHFWVNLAGPVPGLAFQMGEGFYELFPNFPGTEYESRYKLAEDIGRYLVTGIETDKRMWRVQILRNVALTAPYFHNGSVSTLNEAVRVMAKTQLNVTLSDDDAEKIMAFLNALTGQFPAQPMPRLPELRNTAVYGSEK